MLAHTFFAFDGPLGPLDPLALRSHNLVHADAGSGWTSLLYEVGSVKNSQMILSQPHRLLLACIIC